MRAPAPLPPLADALDALAERWRSDVDEGARTVLAGVDLRAVYWLAFTARTLRVLGGVTVGFDVSERHGEYVSTFAAAVQGAMVWRGTRRARRAQVAWQAPALAAWLQTQQPRYPVPPRPTRASKARALDATQPCSLDVPLAWCRPWLGADATARAWVHGLWDASGSVIESSPLVGVQALLYGPAAIMTAIRDYWYRIAPGGFFPPPRPHPTTRAARGVTLAVAGPARLAWFRSWLYASEHHAWAGFLPLRDTVLQLPLTREEARGTPGRGASPYRGVAWDAERGQWRVRLVHGGHVHDAGFFADERAAALAYDALRVRCGLPPKNRPPR